MPCERTSACCCCHRFPHPIGTSTLKGSAPKPHVRGCLGLLPASRRPAVYLDSDGGELGREALGRAILSSLGAVLLLFPFSLIVIPKASLWKLQNNGSAICACVAACALITGPRVPSLSEALQGNLRRGSFSTAALPPSPPVTHRPSYLPSPRRGNDMEYLSRNGHLKATYIC